MFPNLEAEQARNGQCNGDVAMLLGISRQSYETKKKNGTFKFPEIRKLCDLYGQDFEYLFATKEVA